MSFKHRRSQRVEPAPNREPCGEKERKQQRSHDRPSRGGAEFSGQGEAGVMQASQDRSGRNGEKTHKANPGNSEFEKK